MSDAAQNLASSEPGEQTAAAYAKHYEILEYLVVQRFHVPEDDVQSVIHEVFLAFIRNRSRIRDERSWLVGATCIQSRNYWRQRGGEELRCGLDDEIEPAAAVDDMVARVEVSRILRRLSSRCRHLLHLRFFEEYSSQEIATQLATTVDYARKLVHRCVLNARALLTRVRRRS